MDHSVGTHEVCYTHSKIFSCNWDCDSSLQIQKVRRMKQVLACSIANDCQSQVRSYCYLFSVTYSVTVYGCYGCLP